MTLTEALNSLGIIHKPQPTHDRRRSLFSPDGRYLGSLDVTEGWQFVEQRLKCDLGQAEPTGLVAVQPYQGGS